MGKNNSDIRGSLEAMDFFRKTDVLSYVLAENKFVKQFDIDILLQNIDIALDKKDKELFIKLTNHMKTLEN